MCKKFLLSVFGIALLCIVSACGTEATELPEEGAVITVFYQGENKSQSVDAELLELLEMIVSEECKAPLMLSLQLPLSETEVYKEDGTYIEVMYENGKAFPVMTDASEAAIDEVRFLIGSDSLESYIRYVTEENSRIFALSQASCDAIREHLE